MRRFGLGGLAFVAYLAAAQLEAGLPAVLLAIGFFLILQRWVIDGPSGPRMGETYLWAVISFLTATATFAIWWWSLGSEALQAWSTHVWLPIGIVSIALALEGYRRPSTPAVAIGQALAQARTRRAPAPPNGEASPEA